MPWNGKEEKIIGTGCNHHEMMVATEKLNPMIVIFYLSKAISLMFFLVVCILRFPQNKRNTYPNKKNNKKSVRRKTPPSQSLHRSYFTKLVEIMIYHVLTKMPEGT